jgi:hypothetical protein
MASGRSSPVFTSEMMNRDPHMQSQFSVTPEGASRVEVSGDELRAANADDEHLVAWIDLAIIDDEFVFGGGAAPIVSIRRIS